MPVRLITSPRSLNGAMAGDKQDNSKQDSVKPDTSEGEKTQGFSQEAREPLASHKSTISKPGVTFAHEEDLPKLPIPELDSTLTKYLAALKPLQSSREHEESKLVADEFLKHEGPGLQEKLKKYAEGKSSYIEQFWYDSYLNFDNPVVLNLNPFFLLEDDPTPARNNQVTRAASLVVSALSFVRAVRKEELPPDTIRGTPLCMYQYSRLFGTARIPTENGCQIGQDPTSKHIVVLCRGAFYWFDVLDDNSDLIMTEKDLTINLQVIVDDAEQIPIRDAARQALGVLSTENRKVWSGLRDVLNREENNADCLNIVDSALFVLCLDYTEPANGSELCMNMLCGTSKVEQGVQIGTCTNRWYDKLQIIVCKNGSAGINFEHTGVDGHTVLRFASDVYTDTILRFARTINGNAPSLWASTSPDPAKRDPDSFGDVSTTPHKLEWDMVPELAIALRFAETRLADLIQQNEFQTLDFMTYGKNFMTLMGFSPDAFVQMAFQAAYYGLYGRVECVYEPAMTKAFYHGRTEAIRPVTPESVEFVKTFWGDNPIHQKIETLKKACEKHVAITKECAKAQGQDRHLYALYCVWQRAFDENVDGISSNGLDSNGYSTPQTGSEVDPTSPTRDNASENGSAHGRSPSGNNHHSHNMPAIFTDSGWDKLNNTILSTSNCGNPSLRQFGFGPTSGDGFGIGYIIKDNSVSICASSKHRQTKRFVDAIEAYFMEIRRILKQTQRRGTSTDKMASRAREAEERARRSSKHKTRGKVITGEAQTPAEDSVEATDDEGLGGCRTPPSALIKDGLPTPPLSPQLEPAIMNSPPVSLSVSNGFFDSGMLLQALKASEEPERPSEKAISRRNVGKKLRLMEY